MCGIAGFLAARGELQGQAEGTLAEMLSKLSHRGPDDSGRYSSARIALGHRRLSIIDLEGGHQPIANEDGSVHAVVNGEIYNFVELRRSLEERGHVFTTRSDSEVVVHLWEEHRAEFVKHLRGMFALALWDEARSELLLARDRFGIKPLYYVEASEQLVFASEIKSLLAHPDVAAQPDFEAIYSYLCLRYVPGPATAIKDVKKLMPGHVLTMSNGEYRTERYWELPEIGKGRAPNSSELREALLDAVKSHLVSDVPLGVFLSGGLDSSLIVALMREAGVGSVRTFTMGFPVVGADERAHATRVARHFQTEHTELQLEPVSPVMLTEVIYALDEPIADPAVVPTYLLAREARKHVKVVLTGEGSDEINGGYSRYWLARAAAQAHKWPSFVKRLAKSMPLPGRMKRALEVSAAADPEKPRLLGFDFFGDRPIEQMLDGELLIVAQRNAPAEVLASRLASAPEGDFERALCRADITGWMVDDLLMKVDKMTMAHALEARVPYLDHCFAEIALRVPPEGRVQGLRTKALLREVAIQLLPSDIAKRRQHGFNVPLKAWLKGSFQGYAESILLSERARKRSIFVQGWVRETLQAAGESQGVAVARVWSLLVLELWMRAFVD